MGTTHHRSVPDSHAGETVGTNMGEFACRASLIRLQAVQFPLSDVCRMHMSGKMHERIETNVTAYVR